MRMEGFTVHDEGRNRWAWTVRWRGGRTYCRAETERDAKRIAEALEGHSWSTAELKTRRKNEQ